MRAETSGRVRWVRVSPTANLLVFVAVHVLPAGATRDRYRVEHDAELRALPARRQVAYALGALMTSVDLRRATSSDAGPAVTEHLARARRPVLCWLNVRHAWRWEHTTDGGRYRRCERCGKDHPGIPHGPGDWLHGA
jgi:hypothetical protein